LLASPAWIAGRASRQNCRRIDARCGSEAAPSAFAVSTLKARSASATCLARVGSASVQR